MGILSLAPQKLGLRTSQATFPGTQESKDCGIFWALGITCSPEVTPHLSSPHDAESQKSSGRNLDACQFYLFPGKFVAKPAHILE